MASTSTASALRWRPCCTLLDRVDPQAAKIARHRYGCLTPWQEEPEAYGYRVLSGKSRYPGAPSGCLQLSDMLSKRLAHAQLGGLFRRRAKRTRRASRRTILSAGCTAGPANRGICGIATVRDPAGAHAPSWAKLQSHFSVWVHNSHIGNAAATAMGWQGEFNVGELCRTAYDDEAVLIGFGTDRGTVAASSDWAGPSEVKTVRPARRNSYEYAFRMTGLNRALADWRGKPHGEQAIALREPLLERAIGVVYQAEFGIPKSLFRGGPLRTVRRLRLVRGDTCGDALVGRASAPAHRNVSLRPVNDQHGPP